MNISVMIIAALYVLGMYQAATIKDVIEKVNGTPFSIAGKFVFIGAWPITAIGAMIVQAVCTEEADDEDD